MIFVKNLEYFESSTEGLYFKVEDSAFVFFEKYYLRRQFVFSLVPRFHGLCG